MSTQINTWSCGSIANLCSWYPWQLAISTKKHQTPTSGARHFRRHFPVLFSNFESPSRPMNVPFSNSLSSTDAIFFYWAYWWQFMFVCLICFDFRRLLGALRFCNKENEQLIIQNKKNKLLMKKFNVLFCFYWTFVMQFLR